MKADQSRAKDPGTAEDEQNRPRRRKRRKRVPDDDTPNPFPVHFPSVLPFLVVGFLTVLWAVLIGLTFVTPAGVYWLGGCGVGTFIVGTIWVVWAAKSEGVEMWAPWEGTGVVALFQAIMQLVSIPVLSVLHLMSNFVAALPPALVLLMGIGMVISAVLLGRYS